MQKNTFKKSYFDQILFLSLARYFLVICLGLQYEVTLHIWFPMSQTPWRIISNSVYFVICSIFIKYCKHVRLILFMIIVK